jgi:glucose/arabinose dehydrogenase
VMRRVSSQLVLVLVVLVSFAALALRSRPLARMSTAIEPLLVTSGLDQPRALRVQPDGSVVVAEPPPLPAELPADLRNAAAGAPLPPAAVRGPDGALYATQFATRPNRPASGAVVRVAPDGHRQPYFEGLTYPVALAFAPHGQLYVAELSRGYDERTGQFVPNSGRILALGPGAGRRRTITRDVNFPTALLVDAAGDLYFTENGIFSPPGTGLILRIAGESLRIVG